MKINRLALRRFPVCAVATAVILSLPPLRGSQAQGQAKEDAAVSQGENFSAKPAPALFTSDCTGGGCHNSPQGLAKGQSQASLAGFLREHYTNSRESAGALAAYLVKLPSAPTETRAPKPHPSARPSRAAARSDETPAKPASRAQSGTRAQRARQSAAPPPPMPPEPPAPEPPPPKQFDIFD